MPKLVDEVLLIKLEELTAPVATPTINDLLYFGYAAGGLGRKITIGALAAVIADQLGTAAILPDRVYRPFTGNPGDMPTGSSIANGSDLGFFGTNNVIVDPYLDGKVYTMFRRGPMSPADKGPEWQNDIPGGGIRLTQIGDEFVEGDNILIHFQPELSSVIITPDAVGKFSNGEQEITANTVAGAGNDRKIIIMNGATSTAISYTLNAAYPENVLCVIRSASGGPCKQNIILPPGGQTLWDGQTRARIVIGEADYCILVRIGTIWRVVSRGERWQHIGEEISGGIPGPNKIWAEGQVLSKASYPGLADWLAEYAAFGGLVNQVLSAGAWTSSKKFGWGEDASNIYVPDKRGRYKRNLDRGRDFDQDRIANGTKFTPGSTLDSQNKLHDHKNGDYDELLKNDGQMTVVNTDNTGGQPNLGSSQALVADGGWEARANEYAETILISI